MTKGIPAAALPALCTELGLRDEDGVPLVNTRDVAERFGKDTGMSCAISGVITEPKFGLMDGWFRETRHIDGSPPSRLRFDP